MEPRDFDRRFPVGVSEHTGQENIPINEILSLQSLAMGVIGEQARRLTSKDKMTGYVLFDNSRGAIGSGTIDTYMGVVARRPSINNWRLSISFLSMVNTHELRYSNTRELYRFDWNKAGKCLASKLTIDNFNPVVSTTWDPQNVRIDTVEHTASSVWRPIDVEECDELANRMLETATQIKYRWLDGSAA